MKARKLSPAIKGNITKMFKKGVLLPEIKRIVSEKFPKITTERLKTVLRSHFMGLCDELWSEAVKLKAGDICIVDKRPCTLNSHHLIGRSNFKYRWDVDNGVSLGIYRHTMAHDMAAHGSTSATQAFAGWMIAHRSSQWLWFIDHRHDHENIKVDVYFLLETAERLEKYIADLRANAKPDILARKKVTDEN